MATLFLVATIIAILIGLAELAVYVYDRVTLDR